MFCPRCGKTTEEVDSFCRFCGASLTISSSLASPNRRDTHQTPSGHRQTVLQMHKTLLIVVGVVIVLIVVGLISGNHDSGEGGGANGGTPSVSKSQPDIKSNPAEGPSSTEPPSSQPSELKLKYTTLAALLSAPCSGTGQEIVLDTDPITWGTWSLPSLNPSTRVAKNTTLSEVRSLDLLAMSRLNPDALLDQSQPPPFVKTAGVIAVTAEEPLAAPVVGRDWRIKLLGGVEAPTSTGWNTRIPLVEFLGYTQMARPSEQLELPSSSDQETCRSSFPEQGYGGGTEPRDTASADGRSRSPMKSPAISAAPAEPASDVTANAPNEKEAERPGFVPKSDAAIVEELNAALWQDESLKTLDIRVSCAEGIVTLSGRVNAESQKATVEAVARQQSGVRSVIDQLVARP